MDKMQWVKELVQAEQQMEESGVVDFSAGFDPESMLYEESLDFLEQLKGKFIESITAFNQLKGSTLGLVKIYGISNTDADFMLFRNGFKLIFSLYEPGAIVISFHHLGANYLPGQSGDRSDPQISDDDILQAQWGAFGDVEWTYEGKLIRADYLVRYYLSRFIRASAK